MTGSKVPCTVCGKKVPLTAGGTFRKHSTYATVCPSSGTEPGVDEEFGITLDPCEHPSINGGTCAACGAVMDESAVPEGCYCGHGPYHHAAGGWPHTPINGRCMERGCDCSEFQRRRA